MKLCLFSRMEHRYTQRYACFFTVPTSDSSSFTYSDQYSAKHPLWFPENSLCAIISSLICCPENSSCLVSYDPIFSTQRVYEALPGFPSLQQSMETLSRQKNGVIIGLTLFYQKSLCSLLFLRNDSVLFCLMSNV